MEHQVIIMFGTYEHLSVQLKLHPHKMLTNLLTSYNRFVIRKPKSEMRSHGFRQHVCNKLVTELLFVKSWLLKLLSTGFLQVVSTSCKKSANDKLELSDFNRLVWMSWNKFAVTRWQVTSFQQAGKIDELQYVSSVLCLVNIHYWLMHSVSGVTTDVAEKNVQAILTERKFSL